MKFTFTSKTLGALLLPDNKKKVSFTDLRTRGLQYELRPNGGFFTYRYSCQHGQRSIPIGKFGVVTIADARTRALVFARMVALGQDPLQEKQDQRNCITLEDFFIEKYLPFAKVNKRSWKSDVSLFKNHIQQNLGRFKINSFRTTQIREFLYLEISNGFAKGTANRMLYLISRMFNLAIDWDLTDLKKNPAKGIKSFEENNKLERYITPQQALALNLSLNESENSSLKFIVALLLVTGARKQEALQAKWQDIDFNSNVWRIPVSKSGKVRYIPLSETAQYFLQLIQHHNLNILGSRAEACPYVFPNPKTLKPFTTFFYSWHTARCKAGLPDVRIHDLRHTFASTLVNQGVPLYEVQKLLGHSQIRTTERYAHLSQSKLQESSGIVGKVFQHILLEGTPKPKIL